MSILITGGLGFIGSSLVRHMRDSTKVIIMDRIDYTASLRNIVEPDKGLGDKCEKLSHGMSKISLGPNVLLYKVDMRDITSIRQVFANEKDITTVVHMAAQSHVDNSFCNSITFTQENVLGTHNLLEVVRECYATSKINCVILFSTDEVYGRTQCPDDRPWTEDCLLLPTNPYAASKAASEMMAHSYVSSFKLPIIITRCSNVYGPRQFIEKLIPKAINSFKSGIPFPIHGTGEQRRRYIHVEDVARALKTILDSELSKLTGEVVNISGDVEMTNLQVCAMLHTNMRAMGLTTLPDDAFYYHTTDRHFNDVRYNMTCHKLKALGFQEKYAMPLAICDVINWYMSNEYQKHWPLATFKQIETGHPLGDGA